MWFDGQTAQFEDTAGLEPAAGRSIAQTILEIGSCTRTDIVLDVGAGTGTIGYHFADLGSRYIGLDRSWPMLQSFRRKFAAWPKSMLLVQADGNRPWPIRDHALAVVFVSRVTHHLQTLHFVHEVFRVCHSGGHLLLGQIIRDVNSLPSQLRRYKRTLLSEHGVSAPPVGPSIRQIVEACVLSGANPLPPIAVAHWTRTTTAARIVARWKDKPQLSSSTRGNTLDAEQQADIVQSLTVWARREFGDVDCPHEFWETYALQDVRLP
jgi:SAM-dependent methyltransferase